MARSNPFVGHSDFYLIDLWQGRAGLPQGELQALREEMSRRGLDVGDGGGAAELYREAPEQPVGQPCPVCGCGMREGEVSMHKGAGVMGLVHDAGLGMHLHFRRRGGDETIVLRHAETRSGAMCEDCGSVIVRGQFAK